MNTHWKNGRLRPEAQPEGLEGWKIFQPRAKGPLWAGRQSQSSILPGFQRSSISKVRKSYIIDSAAAVDYHCP